MSHGRIDTGARKAIYAALEKPLAGPRLGAVSAAASAASAPPAPTGAIVLAATDGEEHDRTRFRKWVAEDMAAIAETLVNAQPT